MQQGGGGLGAHDDVALPSSLDQARLAYLALGDIDAALDIGHQVITPMGGIDSARATSTIEQLRGQLTGHQHIPTVRDFLDYVA
ncbi:hypothetical protein GCM10010442_34490 [Kitasatospora kifunensis]